MRSEVFREVEVFEELRRGVSCEECLARWGSRSCEEFCAKEEERISPHFIDECRQKGVPQGKKRGGNIADKINAEDQARHAPLHKRNVPRLPSTIEPSTICRSLAQNIHQYTRNGVLGPPR